MVSVVLLKGKKVTDVKTGDLPRWILIQDFILTGTAGAFQRGYYWYYKYVNVKKASISGVSMVLTAYVLFKDCCPYKELKHEQRHKYH
ncbi:ATP synthase subunit f, mitochondrial-like [Rhinolophus ferrumequinum]|uniref:ATP synthase F(0) complex subunit f, mitochondrial n=1 Tax=Rhinolophus ferrumequinum TaxID=59479 RepID=A0A671FLX3_RHIFE|nr:ATP synthase subunit f, mitochondrial-like [Rhinolophus ferrumequinum]